MKSRVYNFNYRFFPGNAWLTGVVECEPDEEIPDELEFVTENVQKFIDEFERIREPMEFVEVLMQGKGESRIFEFWPEYKVAEVNEWPKGWE
jgi:hypothetical protein